MNIQPSGNRPTLGDNGNSYKLMNLFLAEKQKTSLVANQIARFNILLGILLFIDLTIGSIFSWARSISTIISGYFFSFFLIGIGICMLRVYGINFTRKKQNDNLPTESQGNFWTLPSLRKQTEIQNKVLENKVWFRSLASLIFFFSLVICSGEVTFLALGLDMNDFDFKYIKGLCLGFSSLLILTSVLTFVAVKLPSRKIFLILFLLGVLSFIGSVALTIKSAINYGNIIDFIVIKLTRSTEDTTKNYFARNADGHIYFPYWLYFHLLILASSQAATIVVLSFALMLFCLNVLIRIREEKIKEFYKIDFFDVPFVTAGIALPILGFGVHFSYFVLSYITHSSSANFMLFNFLKYFGFLIFAFAGLSSLLSLSQPRSQCLRFVLLLLAITVFVVSIFMIFEQTQWYINHKRNEENQGQCKNSNNTTEFCIWKNDPSLPRGCQGSSSYCPPRRKSICIPMEKKCDGFIDLLPYNNSETFFRCEEDIHSLYSGTSSPPGYFVMF